MSVNQLPSQQLQQDLQNELTLSNQLLDLIASELRQIKEFTASGGKLETNIKENVKSMEKLSSAFLPNVDIENIPLLHRTGLNVSQNNDSS